MRRLSLMYGLLAACRPPSPLVTPQLNIYQENLKQKTKQLAAMNEELAMYKQQVEEFKFDIEGYQKQVGDLKVSWIDSRREALMASRRASSSLSAGGQGEGRELELEPPLSLVVVDKGTPPATAPAAM